MYELPIVARQARDLVEAQFAAAERPRGPARAARARRAAAHGGTLRSATARLLRALADRLEPRPDARPRSA
jgi:hypothetical protein